MPYVLAIDPGREKCGLALVTMDGEVLEKKRIPSRDLEKHLMSYQGRWGELEIVLGDRTGSRWFLDRLRELQDKGLLPKSPIHLVDEHFSTQEARRRFWAEHPPRGWKRFIPLSLQAPAQPFDEYVAVILAERYLSSLGDKRRS